MQYRSQYEYWYSVSGSPELPIPTRLRFDATDFLVVLRSTCIPYPYSFCTVLYKYCAK